MGLFLSRAMDLLVGKRERRIIMLGLDNAGKTTILYKLHLGERITTIPTIGFNVEAVEYKSLRLTIWDVGGQDRLRRLWRHYYQNTDALIFVVDAADRRRFQEAKEELAALLNEDLLAGACVLVYCNKADLPGAATASELLQVLELGKVAAHRGRPWYVQSSCATTGEGLYEGLDWMASQMDQRDAARQTGP